MRLQLRPGKADTDVMDGGDGTADVLKLSTGKHTFGDDNKLKNIEKIETDSSGSEVILSAQKEALEITGSDGVDKITGGEGADTIKGGKGNDEITVAAAGKADSDTMDGEDGTADVLKLSTGKHTFGDDDKLKNIEKIETNSSGSEVILSAQKEALEITGSDGVDKITGGEGADTIKGGKGNDEITVAAAGKADSDTMDGEDGTADVLKLSTGKHTFGDDDKLKNIEKIETDSSGSEVILSAQKEALEITGGDGVDKITGGEGVDTINAGKGDDEITVAAAGKADTDVMDGGDGTADVLKLSTGKHTFGDDNKLKNIEKIETDSSGSEVILSAQKR